MIAFDSFWHHLTAYHSKWKLMTAFDSHPVWAAHKNFAVLVHEDVCNRVLALWEASCIVIHHPEIYQKCLIVAACFFVHTSHDRCYHTADRDINQIFNWHHEGFSFSNFFQFALQIPLDVYFILLKTYPIESTLCPVAKLAPSDPELGSVRYWLLLSAILVSCPERVISALFGARARVGNPRQWWDVARSGATRQ